MQPRRKKPPRASDLPHVRASLLEDVPLTPGCRSTAAARSSVTCPTRTRPGPQASPATPYVPWALSLPRPSTSQTTSPCAWHYAKCLGVNFPFNSQRTPCNSYYGLFRRITTCFLTEPGFQCNCLNLAIRLPRSSP